MSEKKAVTSSQQSSTKNKVLRFCGLYGGTTDKIKTDCSNEFVEQFMEIAPYATNMETGEVNDSLNPKLVKRKDKLNIQKQIDSYADECDVYTIIERAQMGAASYDDMLTMLNRRQPINQGNQLLDVSKIPDNLNDLHNLNKSNQAALGQISPDLENGLKSGIPYDQLEALVVAKIKEQMATKASNSPVEPQKQEVKGQGDK